MALLKVRCNMAPLLSPLLDGILKLVVTQHPKVRCYTAPLLSPLLHGTLKPAATWHDTLKPVATRHPKVHCYTALLQSPLLHVNIFTKSQTIYKNPKYYFGNYL